MIPGLEDAVFLRHGVMHRNTFVDAPRVLDRTLAVSIANRESAWLVRSPGPRATARRLRRV